MLTLPKHDLGWKGILGLSGSKYLPKVAYSPTESGAEYLQEGRFQGFLDPLFSVWLLSLISFNFLTYQIFHSCSLYPFHLIFYCAPLKRVCLGLPYRPHSRFLKTGIMSLIRLLFQRLHQLISKVFLENILLALFVFPSPGIYCQLYWGMNGSLCWLLALPTVALLYPWEGHNDPNLHTQSLSMSYEVMTASIQDDLTATSCFKCLKFPNVWKSVQYRCF